MVRASLRKKLLDQVERSDPELQHLVPRDRPSLVEVDARRSLLRSELEEPAVMSSSRTFEVEDIIYEVPDWLITESFADEVVGPIKGGKEGEVELVMRFNAAGSHLLAQKRYRQPSQRSFRRDQIYREGRKIARGRARKAVAQGTSFGRRVMADQWAGAEFSFLRRLWVEGISVPFAVQGPGPLLMEYIGDEEMAAPRLVDARLTRAQASSLFDQVMDQMRMMTAIGVVHADLSAYNILVWGGEPWIIDFPQAVDLAINPHALDFLRRDTINVCTHFRRYGLGIDPEEEFADLVSVFYG